MESEHQLFDAEELEEYKAFFKQNSLENIADFMSKKIKDVENVSVKIGVTGMAGTGKSTFINTFRGLTVKDNGAAAVSPVESGATLVPQEYHHPRNKNITLWDLPGIGTTDFNKDNYEEKVNFGSYDFFLIFIGNRIYEHDEWLAERAKAWRKKYFIVRTRIDADIASDKLNCQESHDAEHLLTKIRDETKNLLETKGVYPEDGVYLISTLLCHIDVAEWDYRKLEDKMLNVLPTEKRKVLTLSLNNISESLIKEKCEILRSRVWKKAILLAGQGFAPPGLGRVMPQKVIDYFNEEMTSYRDTFGLDEESLRRLSHRSGLELESLIAKTTEKIGLPLGKFNLGALVSFLGSRRRTTTSKAPLVAWLAALSVAYLVSYKSANDLLHDILDRLESASLQVLKATSSSTPDREMLYGRNQGGDDQAGYCDTHLPVEEENGS